MNTKIVEDAPNFKGGITSYEKLKKDIRNALSDTSSLLVTTMIDFYGLLKVKNFPGIQSLPTGNCYQKVEFVEEAFRKDIGYKNFFPYLSLHEFEALIFVDPRKIDETIPDVQIADHFIKIKNQFKSPEEINLNPGSNPSARIKEKIKMYQKPIHGYQIIKKIGIDQIKEECPHFNSWVEKLKSMGANKTCCF